MHSQVKQRTSSSYSNFPLTCRVGVLLGTVVHGGALAALVDGGATPLGRLDGLDLLLGPLAGLLISSPSGGALSCATAPPAHQLQRSRVKCRGI